MSTFILTNKMVLEKCQALFASSKETYNFPTANREKSRHQLEEHIQGKRSEVAYISDFQGAGKSTLMEMAISTFRFKTETTAMVRVKDVTAERLEQDLRIFGMLFVDDADIRTSWKKIIQGLELLRDFGVTHRCPIVVSGDFTIRNEALRELFDPIPRREITMEPVDRQFFLEALNSRLRYLFGKTKEEVPDDANYIFDDELLECLVPDSAVSVATFREILTLAEGLSYQIEPTEEEFLLTKDQAKLYCRSHPLDGPTDQQRPFLKSWLVPFITQLHPRGRGMKPFSAEEVFRTVAISGVEDSDSLSKLVLEPLCRGGVLHALGLPGNRDGIFDRYPGPYLPRPKLLLHAYAESESLATASA